MPRLCSCAPHPSTVPRAAERWWGGGRDGGVQGRERRCAAAGGGRQGDVFVARRQVSPSQVSPGAHSCPRRDTPLIHCSVHLRGRQERRLTAGWVLFVAGSSSEGSWSRMTTSTTTCTTWSVRPVVVVCRNRRIAPPLLGRVYLRSIAILRMNPTASFAPGSKCGAGRQERKPLVKWSSPGPTGWTGG